MRLYSEKIPNLGRIILAGDHTVWSRPDAPTLKERTYEHYTGGGRGGRPVTLGYGYSTIAWIPETEGSWALPLRHERITSWENPIDKATWQLRHLSVNKSPALLKRTTDCTHDQPRRLVIYFYGSP
ncbi:MAG: hypothetical protein KME30_11550 [Iphinoe sp. HA4291-MV1]|jgi:hypothetical protein|nr:hypothetical protein [Iphinoe sp. HA4291-MV1]